jgi:hypothetical protein
MLAAVVDALAGFPHESVPDGAIFGPHHLYVGVLVVLVAVYVVGDDLPRREPLAALVGALVALFGFALTWPYYPETGALLSFVGLLLALGEVLWPGGTWAAYPLRWRAVALVGVLVAFDDVAEHAFGLWTPLDALFRVAIHPLIA